MRTEQEAPKTPQQQEAIAENNGLQFSTTHNSEGEVEVDYENTDNTTSPVAAPAQDTASLIESARDEDRTYQQNLFQEAADWMSDKLGLGSAEERQAEREEGMARNEEVQEQLDNTVGGEVVKTVTSGVEKAAQNAIGAANFAGDFAKTKLGMVDEDDEWNNTDHKNYRGSERDLVFAEPRSTAGQMARDLVSFVVMTRQIGGVTGLSKVAAGQSGAARIAVEAGIGAVADFIADPSDPNAAAALQEFLPATKDNAILSAFATQDDDDEFTRRLKNTIEGGVMGVAVDGAGVALKGLFDAAGPMLGWLKKNPGKVAADAPKEVKDEAIAALADATKASDDRPRLVLKQAEMTKVEQTLPNGETVNWYYTPEEIMGGEITHYDVSWDMASREGKIGTGGKAMVSEFRKQAKDLEPGTVISAQPLADDELGSGAIKRSAAQERAMAKNKAADDAARLKQAEELWIEENADQFPMEFADGTGYATAKEAWDDLDDAAKDNRLERFETEGKIEKGHETGVSNVRGNVYTRMGFGNVDPYHGTQFGVVQADGSIKPIDLTLKAANRAEELAQVRKAIDEARADAPEGSRPGYTERMAEDYANGGTKSRQDYEPYERAAKTTETPMEKVLAEQAADPVSTRAPFTPGAPSPRLTDNTVRQISEADGDIDIIQKGVKELEDSIMPALRAKDPKVVEEAKMRLIKLHNDNSADKIDMSALTEVVGEGGDAAAYVQQVLGNTVAKSYMRDLSVQISELSSQARQIADTGMDANRQYNLILDRLKATSKLQIRDASRRGVGLQSLKNKVLGINETAVAKKIEEFDTKIDTLRDRVNAGDVEAVEEMKVLTDALVLSDGDADMSMSFMKKFFSMTKQNFETTMFNSYLSGLVTHERNFLGNGANVLLKPAQMAMGAIGKPEAKAALSMYSGMWGDLREGFRMARTAFANNVPDRISKMEGFNNMNMAQKLENLRASAKTPQENAAAAFASAQYNLLANPWLQGATRMLDAADRGFRVLSARQKLRFDQNMLAIEDGIRFDAKKYDIVWGTKFKDGEIVDENLLNYAKQDTFQEDLGENMSKVADMINTIPFAKFVIPFVKTPTNIIKQTAHYVPLAGRAVTFTNSALGTQFFKEYDAVMRGSDEAAKAIYRGREGMGVMISILGMGLGTQGLITGQGPQDPQKRKLWEEAGNQAHSINIGGQWVSTRFLGPMGILLSAYADLGMVAANAGTYDDFDQMRNQLIYSTAGALTDQSFLKGLFTSIEGLNDVLSGKAQSQGPDEWVANITRAMTPYQAALRSLNNTLVPGMRDYNNAFEKYFAETLPGAKAFLGSERISMRSGEPVVNGGYSALNQLVPFSLKEAREDPLLNKLVDLGVDMPMEMTDKYKGVELTVQEQNELNRRVAKSGVWEILEARLNSDSFARQLDTWRTEQPPIPRDKAEWYQDIKADLAQARNDAIREYRGTNTEFDQKIRAIEDRDFFGRRGDYYGASRAQSLIDLAN